MCDNKKTGRQRFKFKVSALTFLALVFSHLPAPFSYADDLLQIYNLALQQDPELAQARAQYEADHMQVDIGRSRFLPSLTLSGNTSRNAFNVEDEFSYGEGYNQHDYSVNINQSLINLQDWYNFKSAGASDRRALATLTQAEQNMIVRVATAYFNVLRSQDALDAFVAEEEATALRLEQVQLRFEVELEPVTEVNAAQANYDLARVRRLEEERRLNQARLSLEVITGRMHDELEELSEDFPIVSVEPESIEDWVDMGEENSPAVMIAEADYDARTNDAKAARSALLPTLSARASYGRRAEYVPSRQVDFVNDPTLSATISLNVQVPIFNGGANWARKRQAYYQRDASEQRLELARRQNARDTQDNFISVENRVLAVEANRLAIVSARSALEAVEAGADAGVNNAYDVATAQQRLYQAIRDHANARYDYVLDTLRLKQSAGVLTPEDVRALNEWLE